MARKDENIEIKEKIRQDFTANLNEMLQDIKSLEPKERVAARMKLLDYFMPKVQAVKIEETKKVVTAMDYLKNESAYEDEI